MTIEFFFKFVIGGKGHGSEKKDYELKCSFYTKLENLRDQINGGRWKLDVES